MTRPITPVWTPDHAEAFRKELRVIPNTLPATGLFDDTALAALLEKHPAELTDIITMNADEADRDSIRAGAAGGLSGAQILEAVRRGRFWINLRRAMNVHPEYAVVFAQMFDELKALNPGFDPVRINGGILVSSPKARAPYHIDKTDTILWHVRGRKRVWVYPIDEETLPEREFEEMLMHDTNDDLPYDPAWDQRALSVDLEPGQTAIWGTHQPHRVSNLDSFCVSVASEYTCRDTRELNGAIVTNGVLRRAFGVTPSRNDAPAVRKLKFFAGAALKRAKIANALAKRRPHDDAPKFTLALEAEGCLEERPRDAA